MTTTTSSSSSSSSTGWYIDSNLTILDQWSTNIRPGLLSQNGINFIVHEADDFIIPPTSTFIINNIMAGIDDCRSLFIEIGYSRSRSTQDPDSLTYCIYSNLINPTLGMDTPNSNNNGGTVFCKTKTKPLNDWNINLNIQGKMILRIDHGEVDDDGRIFVISSSHLRSRTRYWFSFYVTMPLNFSSTGFTENRVSWLLYDNSNKIVPFPSSLAAIQSPYITYDKTSQYFFKDNSNIFRYGFINWIPANTLEPYLNLPRYFTSSLNLIMKIKLLCRSYVTRIDIIPSEIPVNTPSNNNNNNNETNITSGPTNTITIQPTIQQQQNTYFISLFVIILLIILLGLLIYIIIVMIRREINKKKKKKEQEANKELDLDKLIQDFTVVDPLDHKNKGKKTFIVPYDSPLTTTTTTTTTTNEKLVFVQVGEVDINLDIPDGENSNK